MKPPHHKIAYPLRIFDIDVKYWDNDRATEEIEALEEGLAELDDEDVEFSELMARHPVVAYKRGTTHFDMDAPGAVFSVVDGELESVEAKPRDYLVQDPPVFVCARLRPGQVATAIQLGEEVGAVWALQAACKGVEGVEGFEWKVGRKKIATDGQMEALMARLGYDALARIGQMLVRASREPTPAEKKPSGSSRGGQ